MKKCLAILLFIASLSSVQSIYADFKTLSQAVEYAKQQPEYPAKDNGDWLNPDYSSFHHRYNQGILGRAWSKVLGVFGMYKRTWHVSYFKELLEKVAEQRALKLENKDHVLILNPSPNNQFTIWGDIQGAFHSLLRDLQELQKKNIISEDFKINDSHHYFIFNGNIIDRSPYCLETLTLVLKLMDENPHNVIYIRGTHEDNETWKHYGLRRELEIRAHHLSLEKVPLESSINKLFKSLPLAFYLRMNEQRDKSSFIRISHFGRNDSRINEQHFSSMLHKKHHHELITYKLDNEKTTHSKKVDIKVIIKAQSRSTQLDITDGLKMINPDKGATAWSLLSAPTSTFQNTYHFYNDAFVSLNPGSYSKDWTMCLHYQDVRSLKGFKKKTYNIVLGQEISETSSALLKRENKEIVVGSSVDLYRSSASLGKQLLQGLSLRINEENQKINENAIRLILLDDSFVPAFAHHNIESILKKFHTNIMLSPLATATVEPWFEEMIKNKILVLFPYSGADLFRKNNLHSVINYRASYAQEAQALIQYAVAVGKLKKFALFYQDDAYGRSGLEGARAALKENNIKDWLEASYVRNTTDVGQAAKKISEFGPEVILFFSTYAPSAELIRMLDIQTLASQTLMGISAVGEMFQRFAKNHGLQIIMSRVVPDPHTSSLEIVDEYRKEMYKNNPFFTLSSESLEGYINASLFIEACNHIKGPVTKEALISFFEHLKNHSIKGLELSFDPETRQLSNDVWIDNGKKWISQDELKQMYKDTFHI